MSHIRQILWQESHFNAEDVVPVFTCFASQSHVELGHSFELFVCRYISKCKNWFGLTISCSGFGYAKLIKFTQALNLVKKMSINKVSDDSNNGKAWLITFDEQVTSTELTCE